MMLSLRDRQRSDMGLFAENIAALLRGDESSEADAAALELAFLLTALRKTYLKD